MRFTAPLERRVVRWPVAGRLSLRRKPGAAPIVAVLFSLLATTFPVAAQAPLSAAVATPPTRPPAVKVNRRLPTVAPPPTTLEFSETPTAREIFRARVFQEPLVLVGGDASAAENAALATALAAFHDGGSDSETAPLEVFLEAHPRTHWRASLLLNLGLLYERRGAFSRALEALDEAWRIAAPADDPYGRAVADLAVAEWLSTVAEFGQVGIMERRLADLGDRRLGGSAASRVREVREDVATMKARPDRIVASGPEALKAILRAAGRANVDVMPVFATHVPTAAGTSLIEVAGLAASAGLRLVPVVRDTATDLPIPSVVHWKLGHFSAVLARDGDRYQVVDPALRGRRWIEGRILLSEMSGHALVPAPVPAGWAPLSDAESSAVVGHSICPPGGPGTDEPPADPPNCQAGGMPVYDFHPAKASLRLTDIPVGYASARGPAAQFQLTYNQREDFRPQIPTFSHVGPRWTFGWLSYVKEEPSTCFAPAYTCYPYAWLYLSGGWRDYYSHPDAQGEYPVHPRTRAVLARTSTSPLRYERRLPDGTVETFGHADGAAAGNQRVFLTQIRDPQGQTLEFAYDATHRLVAATDALGQVWTVSYQDASDELRITRVEDPFGRAALLSYNAAGQLASITDVLGLTTSFAYGPEDFVEQMTTPYGTTTFRHEGLTSAASYGARYIEATDSEGATERLTFLLDDTPGIPDTEAAADVPAGFSAWNVNLDYANTLYWDKRAWAAGGGSVETATITHWMWGADTEGLMWVAMPVPHSIKRPLERRQWFTYPGQAAASSLGVELGWLRKPSSIAQVLDDGTTQVTQFTYNTKGQVLSQIDPAGRRTEYTYAANGIDLLEVRNTTGTRNDVLLTLADYTSQHMPQTVTDAAGQTTTFTYNSAGQPLTITNPKNEVTTIAYDATTADVASVTNPVSGAVSTYTYDDYGRMRTSADPDGYTVTVDYDVFDRPTRMTFPDGTFDGFTYDRLDLTQVRDRLGRITRRSYDRNRRLSGLRDPLGRTTSYEWCGCGALNALVDGKGQRTSWVRDVQGRVTAEVRADGVTTAAYVYDGVGRLKNATDPLGQTTNYSYALDDALAQVSYTNAINATTPVSYTYDVAYSVPASMTDGIGTTTFIYKAVGMLGAGRLASVDGPLTDDTVTYAYDELGRRTSHTLNGSTTSKTFDALGRVATLVDALGTFGYTYLGHTARLQTLTVPNGQTSSYTYFGNTADRRLQSIHHRGPGGATLSRFDYTYDAVGNVLTWRQERTGQPAFQYAFAHDAADQLVGAVKATTDPVPSLLARLSWGYDAAGNRMTEQVDDSVRTASHDALNRVVGRAAGGALAFAGSVSEPAAVTVAGRQVGVDSGNRFRGSANVAAGTSVVAVTATDGSGNTASQEYEIDSSGTSVGYTYDANGNRTGDGIRTYVWNARNQLVRVQEGGTDVAAFAYDGLGRRVHKTAGGATRTYVYDSWDILEERVGSDAIRYVHGPGIDNVLARSTNGGAATFYLSDHLGSIVQETDGNAQVVLNREYDPWGRPQQSAGTSGYAFTGREWDAEISAYYFRARYYDPDAGRFLSADPAGFVDGPNDYAYVTNSPTAFRDPSGRFVIAAPLVAAALNALARAAAAALAAAMLHDAREAMLEARRKADERETMNERRFENDHNAKKDLTPEEKSALREKARNFPKEADPADTARDVHATKRGMERGDREQVRSTKKSDDRSTRGPDGSAPPLPPGRPKKECP